MKQMGKMVLIFWLLGVLSPNMLVAQEDEEVTEVPEAGSTHYVDLFPAFVTNYGEGRKLRYLKAEITLRVTEEGTDLVEHHMPIIRHELIMLLSKQDSQTVISPEGKGQIRLSALEAVQQALAEEAPGNYVDDLLFTSFVVQR